MPRRRREDAPGSVHHVWARGIEGRALFRCDGDQLDLLERLAEVLLEGGARCLVWALMSNHLHLVLRTGPASLSSLMRRIHTGFAVRFNLLYQRSGYLFQSRFGSRLVRDDAGLRAVIRYVLRNPLEAGLVRDLAALERFRWCGYGALVGVRPALPFEAVGETLAIFGQSTTEARGALRAFLSEAIEAPVEPDVARVKPAARLSALVRVICREHGVLEADLRRGQHRDRAVSRARTQLCVRAVRELGLRPTEVASSLGLSESAVSQALHRAALSPPGASEDGGPSPS